MLGILHQPLLALDQVLNTLLWINGDGQGYADETLSARLFRCHLQGLISDRWYRAVDRLMFWDRDHCYTSWRAEIDRRHQPDHYHQPRS